MGTFAINRFKQDRKTFTIRRKNIAPLIERLAIKIVQKKVLKAYELKNKRYLTIWYLRIIPVREAETKAKTFEEQKNIFFKTIYFGCDRSEENELVLREFVVYIGIYHKLSNPTRVAKK